MGEEYGYECYDTVEDQYFRAGDKWTTVRNLTDSSGIVPGVTAYYSCTCEGGETGRYICRPTENILLSRINPEIFKHPNFPNFLIQVPCYSKYAKRYHEVGSQFVIKTQKDEY